jgi:hypothetical protein
MADSLSEIFLVTTTLIFRIIHCVFAVVPFVLDSSLRQLFPIARDALGARDDCGTWKIRENGEETPLRSGRAQSSATSASGEIRQLDNEREAFCILAFIAGETLEGTDFRKETSI